MKRHKYRAVLTMGLLTAWLAGRGGVAQAADITINTSTNLAESQTNLYAGYNVTVDGSSVTVTVAAAASYGVLAQYQFQNLTVTNGAVIVCQGQSNTSPFDANAKGIAISVASNLTVAGGCSINADLQGFAPPNGPGTANGCGGTYGGRGQSNTKALYGSAAAPTSLGSSGGSSGTKTAGGGAIKLIVGGVLTDNGRISANSKGGGSTYMGSGGSVWITGPCMLTGTGSIEAVKGTAGSGDYSGGGGRISLDDVVTNYAFSGTIKAGGPAGEQGQIGTVYLPANARQNLTIPSGATIIAGNDGGSLAYAFGDLTVYGTFQVGGYVVGQGTGGVITANNIDIRSGGKITADGMGFIGFNGAPTIDKGPGGGSFYDGGTHAGKGYFNNGSPNNTTNYYGSATQPTSMGSGSGSYGGGAIKLVVTNTLTVNGTLSANGADYGSGGNGAGGSIWINTAALAGSGTISTRGGNQGSASQYYGGGGRVAIYYATSTFAGLPPNGSYLNKELHSYNVTARGGTGTTYADGPEDGSVYIMSLNLPAMDNASGATNIQATTAFLNGTLTSTGSAPTHVWVYWGATDRTTNKTWASTNDLGVLPVGALTWQATGLTQNTTNYYAFYASNFFGDVWAQPSASFKTPAPPVVNVAAGASALQPYSAQLNGMLTAGVTAHVFINWGTDPANLPNTLDLGTLAEGAFATNLAGLVRNTTYYYSAYATNSYGSAWAPTTNSFTTLTYVQFSGASSLAATQANLYASEPLVVVSGASAVLTLAADTNYGSLVQYNFQNLIVTNGAVIVCQSQSGMSPYSTTNKGVAISVATNLCIAASSSINADLQGFTAPNGPGTAYSAGATYGGRGKDNTQVPYGSVVAPTSLGSSGGGSVQGNKTAGGGSIKLAVGGILTVDGRLSANSTCGTGIYGGSGGSVWISGGILRGAGLIEADGGPGGDVPGGGGRIAIDDTVTWDFSGNIKAGYDRTGGRGGAGTVYLPTLARQNFTVRSNQTIIAGSDGAAMEYDFGTLTVFGSLQLSGDAVGSGTGCVIRATGVTVQSGGSIDADGWGFVAHYGRGAPVYVQNNNSGGTHAGKGYFDTNGVSMPVDNTTSYYGSATAPISLGSGGEAAGGGGVHLIVADTLTINGTVSANGFDIGNVGCGAGGSIWINTAKLAGTGTISARGGNYGSATMYYGGGGRVAIYYSSSTFSGLPPNGSYLNKELHGYNVTARGGTATLYADGLEDGSVVIQKVVPAGTVIYFR